MQERAQAAGDPRLVLTFAVELPANTSADEVQQWLLGQRLYQDSGRAHAGKTRPAPEKGKKAAKPTSVKVLDVVADRFRMGRVERARAMESD